MSAKEETLPSFGLLAVNDNPNGWGPYSLPERYRDMPYQPFSKDQRIGKVVIGCNPIEDVSIGAPKETAMLAPPTEVINKLVCKQSPLQAYENYRMLTLYSIAH